MKTRSAWKSKRRWAIGLADGTDIDGDDTVCVEVGAALGKLVDETRSACITICIGKLKRDINK